MTTTTQPQTEELPGVAGDIAREHPELWSAVQALGERAGSVGPLDARTRRLVHLAFAVAVGAEGATHSHVRRALAEGIAAAELEHLALLGVTTLGWPQAVRGLSWVRDYTRRDRASEVMP